MKQHEIVNMPVAQLEPAEYNPRDISEMALAGLTQSMERFGVVEPIVWNRATGRVVGGHQRLKVLRAAGVEAVDAVVVDLDDTEERALNIALNNPHITGDFTDGLQDLLREIRADDEALFADLRFDALFQDDLSLDLGSGGDSAPPLPEEPVTQLGDLYVLGDHRLICGDCTDPAVVKQVIVEPASCMWTDPPYGVNYVGGTKEAKTIQGDDPKGLPALLAGMLDAALGLALEPGASVYIAHPAGERSLDFYDAVRSAGLVFRQGLVWVKDQMVLGHADYHYKHEPIIYARVPGDGRWGRGGVGWHGDNSQISVFEVPRPKRSEEHPTMKPVELVAAMLVNATQQGHVVYEPFGGSGTTLIACEQLGRRCRAVELDPGYCDVIVRRWEELTGQEAEKL